MEPGFRFLSSSRGCAPFNLQIQTSFYQSGIGTKYYVNWGDGSPESVYVQVTPGPDGPVISHLYPNASQECYYELTIEAENECNPRGSVPLEPIFVTVWTNDIASINPAEFRVCQGFAASMRFTDNSDWNCYPLLVTSRENRAPRWIQWKYGTGNTANHISGIQIDNTTPGSYPYFDPDANKNPLYPVNAPGERSLAISVPATSPAGLGKEFQVTLRNWNQCNAYDNDLSDGATNPGDLANGDNDPQTRTARIVIVESPKPGFQTRLGDANGSLRTVFCAGEDIYFDNETPSIAGASFRYRWEFFDNDTGAGSPISTSTRANPIFAYGTSGTKLIRLSVRDANAFGDCETIFESTVAISPSLIATIEVTDFSGNQITPDFCQQNTAPLIAFEARFNDVSPGTPTSSTEWRWEFFDQNNALILSFPSGSGFSNSAAPPFDRTFTEPGIYRAVLRIRDNITSCETMDEAFVRVFRNPVANFSFTEVCEGTSTEFTDQSSLTPIGNEQIVLREWDPHYDGFAFDKDPSLDNRTKFSYTYATAGIYTAALRITTDDGGCTAIVSHTVKVHALPLASFTSSVTSGCSELEVTFTNTSAGQSEPIDQYQWEIDDGNGFQAVGAQAPADADFSETFKYIFPNGTTSDRQFDVRLRAISEHSCESVSSVTTITVNPSPPAGFISANYSPFDLNCSPIEVIFNVGKATREFNPSEYIWTVMDGEDVVVQERTGTTPSFQFMFENSGQALKDFGVNLEARLATGCNGDSTRTIRVSPVPSSAFDIDTIAYECEHVVLKFEADQKGLQEYEWAIYSNGTAIFNSALEGESFEFQINRSTVVDQDIEVHLATSNFANCKSATTKESIIVPRTDMIIAAFDADPMVQKYPSATVTLTNNSNDGPWQFNWDFGDGNFSMTSDRSVTHTYSTYGTFPIQLTVSSSNCVKSQTVMVQIDPPTPVLDFSYNPPSGCWPLTVDFTNLSMYADPSTYQWHFGENQGMSNAENPQYTYYEPGLYTVTLQAENGFGEKATVSKSLIIEVFEKPSAQFNLKPAEIEFPGGKLYTDNQSIGASGYRWDFGDGRTSMEFEPIHTYQSEGTFDITLVAINSFGCSDTTTLRAGAKTKRSGTILIPNAFTPNGTGPGGTGQNDYFKPILRGVVDYQLLIFNRWGQLMFETKNPEQGWDGYFQGRLCQQDVYVYKVIARLSSGETITRTGDVNLIR